MKTNRIIVLLASAAMSTISCNHRVDSFDPLDTVLVPDGITGEDSIDYFVYVVTQSPISAEDLLNLSEVHTVDWWIDTWIACREEEHLTLNHRDSCAMRLANRFMRMHHLVDMNGDAMDKLRWAAAVNSIVDTFLAEVPGVGCDTVVDEMVRLFDKFSPQSQGDMNLECYVLSSIDHYRTIDAYRQWLEALPDKLKPLAKEEYLAWNDLNEARFTLWRDVYFTQSWFSMKPMEIEGYYQYLSENRRAEMAIERDIVLNGAIYNQKGKTVTTRQWEQWIKVHSQPEDYEDVISWNGVYEDMPSDSTIVACTTAIRQTFTRWLAARQALAAALPDDRGKSYDNLTADIHSRIIGKLPAIIPFAFWPEGNNRY